MEATKIRNTSWVALVLTQYCSTTHSNSRQNRFMKTHLISVRFTQVPAWKTKHITWSTFLMISQQKEGTTICLSQLGVGRLAVF